MERYFCRDKKDYCDKELACRGCEFAKGSGVINGVYVEDVLSTLFGDDYNLDRLKELVKADREGRCVVLPCKRGDTVWRICGPKGRKFVAPREVQSVTMYEPGKFELFTNCFDWLGKTVFLTEEEAEAALKAMKG